MIRVLLWRKHPLFYSVWLFKLILNQFALKDLADHCKKDSNIAIAAVQKNGWNLKDVDPSLQNDPNYSAVVAEALKENILAIEYVDLSARSSLNWNTYPLTTHASTIQTKLNSNAAKDKALKQALKDAIKRNQHFKSAMSNGTLDTNKLHTSFHTIAQAV